jgi:hypothetical protein
MKRLLLISLTAILGIGSLADVASAHPDHRRGGHSGYYEQEEAPKPAEPIRYRTQLPAEPEETYETYKDDDRRYQTTERFDRGNYRRERRRRIRIRLDYNNGTRNDPGRY